MKLIDFINTFIVGLAVVIAIGEIIKNYKYEKDSKDFNIYNDLIFRLPLNADITKNGDIVVIKIYDSIKIEVKDITRNNLSYSDIVNQTFKDSNKSKIKLYRAPGFKSTSYIINDNIPYVKTALYNKNSAYLIKWYCPYQDAIYTINKYIRWIKKGIK